MPRTKPKKRDTSRVKRFIHEYVWGSRAGNITESALLAGFGQGKLVEESRRSAGNYGCELLRRKDVADTIAKQQAEKAAFLKSRDVEIAEEMYAMSKARLTDALDDNGQLKPVKDWPEYVKAAALQFEIEALPGSEGEADDGTFSRPPRGVLVKVRLHEKKGPGELFLKWAGKLKDVVKHEGLNLEQLVLEADRKLKKELEAAKP